MSNWVKLTTKKHGTEIHVNLDRAFLIKQDGTGSTIVFSEDSKGTWDLKESPEEILKASKANA